MKSIDIEIHYDASLKGTLLIGLVYLEFSRFIRRQVAFIVLKIQ